MTCEKCGREVKRLHTLAGGNRKQPKLCRNCMWIALREANRPWVSEDTIIKVTA